jgi:HEAT repeat protein
MKALPILVDALDAGEVTIRSAAIEALIAYRHPETSRGFSQMFQRANPTEKGSVAQSARRPTRTISLANCFNNRQIRPLRSCA